MIGSKYGMLKNKKFSYSSKFFSLVLSLKYSNYIEAIWYNPFLRISMFRIPTGDFNKYNLRIAGNILNKFDYMFTIK